MLLVSGSESQEKLEGKTILYMIKTQNKSVNIVRKEKTQIHTIHLTKLFRCVVYVSENKAKLEQENIQHIVNTCP